jgi:hypothetical protein
MQERRASLFDEDAACVGELHTDDPSIIACKQAESMLFFDISDLSAERRLGEVQSESGLREVELFAQDNDRVQVSYFDVGKHCSTPAQEFGDTRNLVLPLAPETTSGYDLEPG